MLEQPMHPFTGIMETMPDDIQDYRFAGPTGECLCGSTMFMMIAQFDLEQRLPGWYLTDGMCVKCSAVVTLPTPVDDLPPVPEECDLYEPPFTRVNLNLTCPSCGSSEDTVVDEYETGPWDICYNMACLGTNWNPVVPMQDEV